MCLSMAIQRSESDTRIATPNPNEDVSSLTFCNMMHIHVELGEHFLLQLGTNTLSKCEGSQTRPLLTVHVVLGQSYTAQQDGSFSG
mmetsp:Transcript_4556/g.28902  ORF Transcript_4556/g.28902 Transcript_4556/m.28902 type:complete len:86 (-) Transcript_4556:1752-2009(-)